jgi:Alkaline phosphatase PhoX
LTRTRNAWLVVAIGATAAVAFAGGALAASDFGAETEAKLNNQSNQLFGLTDTIAVSSAASISADEADADPTRLVTLARGLQASVVTTSSGTNTDMMALWPDSTNPTHIISCNEQGTGSPGVQRIELATGATQTILTGTTSCDPVRRTPWGTIIFGEETANGQLIELIDPVNTTGVQYSRTTGVFSGGTNPQNLARRTALGQLAFEGLGLLPNGVLFYGDELRPANGTPGGAYFKFVPATPWTGGPAITNLAQSPFVAGSVQALRIGRRVESGNGAIDYGQGNNSGQGSWVPVCSDVTSTPTSCASTNPSLRSFAAANRITGYYRPEDLEVDQAALAGGQAKVCGANTGIEEFANYGELVCITDGTVAEATANRAVPTVQNFVTGNPQFAMPDNLAYQPGRGNWIVHEDGDQLQGNNDLWGCLPDGTDTDLGSDGCVRIATLNDLEAELTGGIFDADGSTLYISVQHNVTNHGVVLAITGWN